MVVKGKRLPSLIFLSLGSNERKGKHEQDLYNHKPHELYEWEKVFHSFPAKT